MVRPQVPPWRVLTLCDIDKSTRHATTIDMLTDNVLLEVFDLFRNNHDYASRTVWRWHLLVHVCQRWRQIVFASPHRLNLQILCTHRTPVRKNLCIWPVLPIVIDYHYSGSRISPIDEDNVISALEHPDHVCYVRLDITGSQLRKIASGMQKPFPVLTRLFVGSDDVNAPVLPGAFLRGSAPRLQEIALSGIPYPTLPTLLLSASDLVELSLHKIPQTGYISPEAMVACLAVLPRLSTLRIGFRSASRPGRILPPPITRRVLPALTSFRFNGASEYLEDLVAQIDSPQLHQIFIFYWNQFVDFEVAQLSEFIDRSVGTQIALFRHAQVTFVSDWVSFTTYPRDIHPTSGSLPARTLISCRGIDWQVSHMAQVLSHFSTTLSNVVHLKLEAQLGGRQLEGIDDVEWLHLLHHFPTVRTLHVSQELAGHVAITLEDITQGLVGQVLPSLDLIRVVGQLASSIEKFVAGRLLSGCPVTVIDSETEFSERLKSYVSE